jgi:hypothetical protein
VLWARSNMANFPGLSDGDAILPLQGAAKRGGSGGG